MYLPSYSSIALQMGPAEWFFLVLLILLVVTLFSTRDLKLGLGATGIGVLLSVVGVDILSGTSRFTMGVHSLDDGIDSLIIFASFVLLPRAMVAHPPRTKLARLLEKLLPTSLWRHLAFLWRNLLLICAALIVMQLGSFGEPVFNFLLVVALTMCGIFLYHLGIPSIPLYFGFVFGLMLEEHARRALLISRGDIFVVLARNGVLTLIALICLALLIHYGLNRWALSRVAHAA